jgi:hypothetical protein
MLTIFFISSFVFAIIFKMSKLQLRQHLGNDAILKQQVQLMVAF